MRSDQDEALVSRVVNGAFLVVRLQYSHCDPYLCHRGYRAGGRRCFTVAALPAFCLMGHSMKFVIRVLSASVLDSRPGVPGPK